VIEHKFVLRQARPEDAPRLHELHTAAVRTLCAPHYAPEVMAGWLHGRSPEGYLPPIGRGAIFVAQEDSKILGFGEASKGVVVAVYVDPSSIRRGVGRTILARAIQMASREHEGPLRVEATLNACGFYLRHGFREISRITLKRNQVDVPVVLMEMPANRTADTDVAPLRAPSSARHPGR
jgi:GNAT superfamily N-acetyltransferase